VVQHVDDLSAAVVVGLRVLLHALLVVLVEVSVVSFCPEIAKHELTSVRCLLSQRVADGLVCESSGLFGDEGNIPGLFAGDGSLLCSFTECSLLRPSINSSTELGRVPVSNNIYRPSLLYTAAHFSPFLASTVKGLSMAMGHLIIITRKRSRPLVLLPLVGLSRTAYNLQIAAVLHELGRIIVNISLKTLISLA